MFFKNFIFIFIQLESVLMNKCCNDAIKTISDNLMTGLINDFKLIFPNLKYDLNKNCTTINQSDLHELVLCELVKLNSEVGIQENNSLNYNKGKLIKLAFFNF